MNTITIENSGKMISVPQGMKLAEALPMAELALEEPCGGKGKCGKCKVLVNGKEELACQFRVESDISVIVPSQKTMQILESGIGGTVPVKPVAEGYLAAIDLGTTTIVCYLLSPKGEQLAAKSMHNPQASFGADVMTRIQRSLDGDGETMTEVVREAIDQLISDCCQEANIAESQIGVISLVGNPTMQQIFLGICPKNLAEVPFAPVLKKAEIVDAAPYISKCGQGKLLIVPDLSGFVGADTIACVLAGEMEKEEDTILMVDIGTNGEMVLSHAGRMAACSTAAGPALEGASIRFGMRGTVGAIDRVWEEDGRIHSHVIGEGEPVGICGSGLIDAVAVSLNLKLINKRGRITSDLELEGQRIIPLSENLYLTQEDIRQVQLAKGAIAAGIQLMCEALNIQVPQIDKCLLAGAFGSFLNPKNACRIGLLPEELKDKIVSAGNLAGSGAKEMAMNEDLFYKSQVLTERITHLELAQEPTFQRVFAHCMGFNIS